MASVARVRRLGFVDLAARYRTTASDRSSTFTLFERLQPLAATVEYRLWATSYTRSARIKQITVVSKRSSPAVELRIRRAVVPPNVSTHMG